MPCIALRPLPLGTDVYWHIMFRTCFSGTEWTRQHYAWLPLIMHGHPRNLAPRNSAILTSFYDLRKYDGTGMKSSPQSQTQNGSTHMCVGSIMHCFLSSCTATRETCIKKFCNSHMFMTFAIMMVQAWNHHHTARLKWKYTCVCSLASLYTSKFIWSRETGWSNRLFWHGTSNIWRQSFLSHFLPHQKNNNKQQNENSTATSKGCDAMQAYTLAHYFIEHLTNHKYVENFIQPDPDFYEGKKKHGFHKIQEQTTWIPPECAWGTLSSAR